MQLALEKLYDGPCQHGGTHFLSREDGKPTLTCGEARARSEQDCVPESETFIAAFHSSILSVTRQHYLTYF